MYMKFFLYTFENKFNIAKNVQERNYISHMILPPGYSFEIFVELKSIIIKMTYISNQIRDQLLPCSIKLLDKALQFTSK